MKTEMLKESERTGAVGPSSLLRNTAWMAWSGALNIASSVVIWMALARWRSAAEVGQFATVISLQTIFVTICGLGLTPYLTSQLARSTERRKLVASAALLITLWSSLCMAAMIAAGYYFNTSATGRLAAYILSLSIIPTGLISIGEAIFTAYGQARVIALATTTENLLRIVVPLLLLARGASLPVICLSFVLMRLAACAVYVLIARRKFGALALPQPQLMRELAAVAPTFAGVTMLAALHWQLGTALAGKLGGEVAAAEFGVASRFLIPVIVLLSSYVSVIQPAASRLAQRSLAELGDFLSSCLRLVLALALPLALGGLTLGAKLIVLLFGEKYAGASLALGFLVAGIVPFSIVMVAARGLVATGRQRIDLLANLVAVVLNLAANLLLIPRYGATGAAIAQLLSLTAMAAVEVRYGTRPLFSLHIWQACWICRWPLAALLNVLLLTHGLGFWWAFTLGSVTYLLGLALIWDQLRPSYSQRGEGAQTQAAPRILIVGDHPTRTLGGISTLINHILHSPLASEFEFRHIASQADELGKLGKLGLALGALIKFGVLLLWWRPSVAYIHIGCGPSLYRKIAFITLARLFGRRTLVHFHAGNFEPYFAQQSALGRFLIRYGLGQSERFIAVSRELKQSLSKLWPEAEITFVPNGVRTALFAGPRVAVGESVRLLFVGKMGALKGEEDLLRALQRLVQAGLSFRLDLVGPLSDTIAARCQEAGLQPMIDQLGPVPLAERIAFFKRADIFVLPTYAEGLPIAVLEALAAGLPVISTPVGGIPELIEDGVEGYLVAPGDVEALANRLAQLIQDADERQRMGARARAKARHFDEDLMLAQLGTQLRRVAHSSTSIVARTAYTRESSAVVPLQEGD